MPQNAALFAAFSDLKNLPSPEQLITLLKDVDVNAPNEKGYTVLYYAIQAGNLAVARVLLEHGAKLQLEEQPEKSSILCSPFHAIWAVLSSFKNKKTGFEDSNLAVDFIELCVEYAGESILNARSKYSETILHFLAQYPHHAALEKVLSYKSVNFTLPSPNNGHRTPLVFAVENGNDVVAKLMVDKGASINHYTSNRKDTPVFKMMQQDNYDLFDYTLSKHVDNYGVIQARLNNIGEAQITVFVENQPEVLTKLRNLGCLEYRPFVESDHMLEEAAKHTQNVHSTGSVSSMYDSLQQLKEHFTAKQKKQALGAIFGVAAEDHYTGIEQSGITLNQIVANLNYSLPQVRAFYAQQNNQIIDDESMVHFVADAAQKSLERIRSISFIDEERTPNNQVLHKDHKEALALIWLALRDDKRLPVMAGKSEANKNIERAVLHNALWFNLAKVLYEYSDAQACASGLYGAILSSLSGLHDDVIISPENIQPKHDVNAQVITKDGVSAVLADLLQDIYANTHADVKQLYVALKVLDDFEDEEYGFKTLFNDIPTQTWSPELQQFLGKVKAQWAQDFKKHYPAVTELDKEAFLALEESLRVCNLSDLLLQTLQEQLRLCLEHAAEGIQERILNLVAGNTKPVSMFAETMIPLQHWREALKACSQERMQTSGWYQRLATSNATLLKKVLLQVNPDLLGIAPVAVPAVVAPVLEFSALAETAKAFNQRETKGVYPKLCNFLDTAGPAMQEHILNAMAQAVGTIANIALQHWVHALTHRTDAAIQETSWYRRFSGTTILSTVLQKTNHHIVERRSSSETGSGSPARSQSSEGSPQKPASPVVVTHIGCGL